MLESWPGAELLKFRNQQGLSARKHSRYFAGCETLGLTSTEFASVLATSGTTGAEGESVGNSRKFVHLAEAFSTQWCDAALAARDAEARKSEAVVAAVDNFDLSGLSEAASRIENSISWNDADQQINECEADGDEYDEEDVDRYTGDCDGELDETGYTVGTRTGDPELLEQFDGNLEDADASASQVYARELLSRVKSFRGYFLVFEIGAFDGLAQPSTDRKPAQSRGKGKKGKRKGKSSSQTGGTSTIFGALGILPKPQTPRSKSRPPMSKKGPLAQLVVDHITLFVFVLISSACCVDKLDIVHQNVPTKEKRHLANEPLVPVLWVVQCSMPCVMVQLSKKPNKIKTIMTSNTFLRFQEFGGVRRFWIHEYPTSSGSIRGHHD